MWGLTDLEASPTLWMAVGSSVAMDEGKVKMMATWCPDQGYERGPHLDHVLVPRVFPGTPEQRRVRVSPGTAAESHATPPRATPGSHASSRPSPGASSSLRSSAAPVHLPSPSLHVDAGHRAVHVALSLPEQGLIGVEPDVRA